MRSTRCTRGKTHALVNGTTSPTAEFVKNPNWQLPGSDLAHDIAEACGGKNAEFVPAAELATALMGDSIATNMFMLGYAWQKGWVPLAREAIERAIELNGVAVAFNQQVLRLGPARGGRPRARAAHRDPRRGDPDRAALLAQPRRADRAARAVPHRLPGCGLCREVPGAGRSGNEQWSRKRQAPRKLAEAVARYYAKLLAYKDEYEVARLYTDGAFRKKIEGMFEGDYKVVFHLAPPLLAKPDPRTGEPRKMQFGPWMMGAFSVLAKLKGLRGTAFDIFGRTEERRMERALIGEYEHDGRNAAAGPDARQPCARRSRSPRCPRAIRGYGHIKAKSVGAARAKRDELLARYRTRPGPRRCLSAAAAVLAWRRCCLRCRRRCTRARPRKPRTLELDGGASVTYTLRSASR